MKYKYQVLILDEQQSTHRTIDGALRAWSRLRNTGYSLARIDLVADNWPRWALEDMSEALWELCNSWPSGYSYRRVMDENPQIVISYCRFFKATEECLEKDWATK